MIGYSPSSPSIYKGTKLNVVGSLSRPQQPTVDDAGRLFVELDEPVDIGKNFWIQALFEGDDHYTKSESNIVFFETIAHSTDTTLKIDPLG